MHDFSFFHTDNISILGFPLFLSLAITSNIAYRVRSWSMCFASFVRMGIGVLCRDKSVSKPVCRTDFCRFYNVLFLYELQL